MENKSEKVNITWIPKTVSVNSLIPFEKNPRKISPEAYEKLVNSLKEDGYHQRIITTPDLRVIGGHQRIKALKSLGITEIEVLVADREVSDEQFKRILVRDNLGFGSWELDALGELMPIGELLELGLLADIAKAIVPTVKAGLTDDDAVPEPPAIPVTVLGDVWKLGDHRLMCGDSTSIDAVEKLMDGKKADMLLTDPPYNVDYTGKTKKSLKIENDSMSNDTFRKFLVDAFSTAVMVMRPAAVFYIWHADSEGYNFRGACFDVGLKVRQCLVWVKSVLVMGRQDYHWKHEPCLYGWKDGAAHYWGTDRKQTTVLEFDKPQRNGEHPTMKPVELFQYQVLNSTKEGDIVLDLFGGSGTAIIAAEKTGRHARLMELDPRYCDVIITRWQDFTGQRATHAVTGEPFTKPEKAAA
jgi:DNA modification methylase